MSTNDCKNIKKLGLISTVYKSLPFLSCVKYTCLIIHLCTNNRVVSLWALEGLAAEHPAPGTLARAEICLSCRRTQNRFKVLCITK